MKNKEISAASIVAVIRDNFMTYVDNDIQGYGFAKHKGYATEEHITALKLLGPSIYHRFSFKHVSEM